jgi:hypothetical protein
MRQSQWDVTAVQCLGIIEALEYTPQSYVYQWNQLVGRLMHPTFSCQAAAQIIRPHSSRLSSLTSLNQHALR